MNAAFRVDASSLIGTGHFVRCLTLAQELRRRGARTLFISRALPDHLREMLSAQGHGFVPMAQPSETPAASQAAHAAWLGASPARDAAETLEALSGSPWDWLVVDHYGIDRAWESAVRRGASRIAAIDDLADRRHDCDLLLDQNLQPNPPVRYQGKLPSACTALLGPRFALLREEFRVLHESARPRAAAVRRILVFFGGADAGDHTSRAVEAIAGLSLRGVEVDVVAGRRHARLEGLREDCARAGFTLHVQTDRMAELTAAADLAVGAGGTAVWERCCLGLPQIALCTAQNQREQLAAAGAAGLAYCLPESPDDTVLLIRRHVSALLEDQPSRERLSSAGLIAVDGRGALRVAAALTAHEIEVRVVTPADSRKLYEWRNDPAVRARSRATAPIPWETHRRWLDSVLTAKDRSLLIGERRDVPVGVVRFDERGQEAEISIYLVPGDHPAGEGRSLLARAEHWLAANRPHVARIRAEVLGGNARSERLFLGSGYRAEPGGPSGSARFVKGLEGR